MKQSRKEKYTAEQIKKLRDYCGDDEVISSKELMMFYKAQPEPDFKIYTGLPTLDRLSGGCCGGEMIVISGPTKSGKTELCKTITSYICQHPEVAAPLWFTYEVPPKQFLESFPNGKAPLFFLPKQLQAMDLDWFEERCLESWEKNRTKIIIVDHLSYLIDAFKLKNSSLEIGAIIRRIKRFAVQFGFVIFLCAHLTKIPYGETPRYTHLRDSSFVAQEADACWIIYRVEDDDGEVRNKAVLSVDFHRRTGVMFKKFPIMYKNGVIREVSDRHTI